MKQQSVKGKTSMHPGGKYTSPTRQNTRLTRRRETQGQAVSARRMRLSAKRAGWGGEGTVLRRSFLSSGDFWNHVDVPHARKTKRVKSIQSLETEISKMQYMNWIRNG